jgi:hypothetical protein
VTSVSPAKKIFPWRAEERHVKESLPTNPATTINAGAEQTNRNMPSKIRRTQETNKTVHPRHKSQESAARQIHQDHAGNQQARANQTRQPQQTKVRSNEASSKLARLSCKK